MSLVTVVSRCCRAGLAAHEFLHRGDGLGTPRRKPLGTFGAPVWRVDNGTYFAAWQQIAIPFLGNPWARLLNVGELYSPVVTTA